MTDLAEPLSAPAAANPNTLSDRAAMGLPEAYADRIDPVEFSDACARLAPLDVAELAAVAEDPRHEHMRRLAAGSLLALAGDPRLLPDDPAMVDVPAARAVIGLPPEQVDGVVERWAHVGVVREWIEKETPPHTVDLAAYRIARYPVTNAEYRLFLLENPSVPLPTSWQFGVYPAALANHPVWTVEADDADAYAAWLARRTGRAFRLPTEAEWEYAAAGPEGLEFPWGSEPGGPRQGYANTVETGPGATTAVGVHPAGQGPFGTHDMAGNVEEYVADAYRPYPGGPSTDDDLARTLPSYRVARGGSFTRYRDLARTRRRHGRYPRPIYAMGFRLAETPPAAGPRP